MYSERTCSWQGLPYCAARPDFERKRAPLTSAALTIALEPTAAETPVLSITDLSVRFRAHPPGVNVVDGLSFSVPRGKTLCLVGESGCGKSVASLSIMGLLPRHAAEVTRGTIAVEGRDLLKVPERELADLRGDRMAMIFQEPMTSLNPAYTIGDQIAESVVRHRGSDAAAARARALELLERVRIPAARQRLDAYPHELSGGMRQRAMIAMALVNDPVLLIADEPTTALDVTIQAQILALIAELQREAGTAVVLVTHDLGVVAEVADEIVVMYAGRVVERGPVAAVFTSPQHPYTIGLLGSMPALGRRTGRLAAIPGSVPPPEAFPVGCRFSSRCPFARERCGEVPALRALERPDHFAACHYAPIEMGLAA
jgi:peptide/nickel transport system ATP-binding protein